MAYGYYKFQTVINTALENDFRLHSYNIVIVRYSKFLNKNLNIYVTVDHIFIQVQ